MHEWLSGEKTLPEATREWLTNRTRIELALMLLAFLVQSYVGGLLGRAVFVALRAAFTYVRTTPPRTVVDVVFPVVLSLQILYLMLKARRISAAVAGESTERRGDSRNVITGEDKEPTNEPTTTPEGPDDPV